MKKLLIILIVIFCNKLSFAQNNPVTIYRKNIPAHKGMFYTFGVNTITDSTVQLYTSLGVTSIETYVTWQSCEPKTSGDWDWSRWDKIVKILKRNNLKWVPFLILGPAYSTPDWFRASKDHVPCRCLEHDIASKIESRWNPNLPKWVDRFLKAFSKRYKKSGVIESVLLGIQGDYGEAIYSVSGGGWTFNIPGKYHNHPGFWCNDPYALADFRKSEQKHYKKIKMLNKAWGTGFNNFGEVDFPGYGDTLKAFEVRVKSGNDPHVNRRWLDFIAWYRGAMTRWADWWLGETRKYFKNTPIYLCTGGDAEPRHGSNFAEQARVAARHMSGIRITNEGSDYARNFVFTNWVASACQHYGTYYGFEPAGQENEKGIVARIYNATASGANQLHDYANNITGSSGRIEVQRENIKYLFHTNPIVPIALWYPNTSLTLNWTSKYFDKAAIFRDYSNFDYVDETMLYNEALSHYKVLVIIWGKVMERTDAKKIANWVKRGGHLIVMDVPEFADTKCTDEPEHILFGNSKASNRKIDKGQVVRVNNWEELIPVLRKTLQGLRLPVCDLTKDSIYVTQTGEKQWLFLNNTKKETIYQLTLSEGKKYKAVIKPEAITEIIISYLSHSK